MQRSLHDMIPLNSIGRWLARDCTLLGAFIKMLFVLKVLSLKIENDATSKIAAKDSKIQFHFHNDYKMLNAFACEIVIGFDNFWAIKKTLIFSNLLNFVVFVSLKKTFYFLLKDSTFWCMFEKLFYVVKNFKNRSIL